LDNASFPESRKELGRWLGVSHRVGQAMCFFILTGNGTVISRSSVQALNPDEIRTEDIKNQIQQYDQTVNNKIGNHINSLDIPVPNMKPLYILDMDDKNTVTDACGHNTHKRSWRISTRSLEEEPRTVPSVRTWPLRINTSAL
jgi:hypothetical protein